MRILNRQKRGQDFWDEVLVRMVLGVVLLIRSGQLAWAVHVGFGHTSYDAWVLAYMGLVSLFTIGFLTPLTTVAVVMSAVHLDALLQVHTLGTTTAVQVLTVLLFVDSGRCLSLDSVLRGCKGVVGGCVRGLESILGRPSAADYRVAYFYGLLAYGLVSAAALSLHLDEPYWLEGHTVGVLLTSSWHCKYFAWFRAFEAAAPQVFWLMSLSAVVLQTVFQFLMLPLCFSRRGIVFVHLWGWNFFLISLFFIQLSYLPHVELCLWALLFLRLPCSPPRTAPEETSPYRWRGPLVYTLVLSCTYVLWRMPGCAQLTRALIAPTPTKFFYELVSSGIYRCGYDLPDVFNRTDLEAGDRWCVITRQEGDNSVLVPYEGESGQRLSYFGWDLLYLSNYGSDFLYFRALSPLRRGWIGRDLRLPLDASARERLQFLILFDVRTHRRAGRVLYTLHLLQNASSDVTASVASRYTARTVRNFWVAVENGNRIQFFDRPPDRRP